MIEAADLKKKKTMGSIGKRFYPSQEVCMAQEESIKIGMARTHVKSEKCRVIKECNLVD